MSEVVKEELKTKKLYQIILSEVHSIVKNANKETRNKKLSMAHKLTIASLSEIEKNIKTEYENLKKNAEWNNFTIVFYGETNAGKSTIIETLRILLNEKTKVEERNKLIKIKRKNINYAEKKYLIQEYSDGAIIGNGKSDYTQENKIYTFDNGDCKYKIIDVPGIEGEESQVIKAIMEAVQKAHVVFFVTRKETPPQVVNSEEGILGKIKKHLGKQAEVWTIFNKSVTNVNALKKIKDKEEIKNNLMELNKTMETYLGEQYKGEVILSAYPAFLAVAKNLDKEKSDYRKKEKFLKEYSEKEILEHTGFLEFNRILKEKVIQDIENKIIISNQKKAMHELKIACSKIKEIKKEYESIQDGFERNYKDSSDKLSREKKFFEKNIDNNSEVIIRGILDDIRNNSNENIKENIDNNEYKKVLKDNIKNEIKKLERDLKSMYSDEFIALKSKTDEMINETMQNYGKLIEVRESRDNKFKKELDFDELIDDMIENMDLGINWKDFFGSLLTFTLSVIKGRGIVLIAGVVTAVIKAINAFFSFFSSSYRRKQQMKGVEKLIEKLRPDIESEICEINGKVKGEMEKYSKLVDEVLKGPCNEVKEYMNNLNGVILKLEGIQIMEENHEK